MRVVLKWFENNPHNLKLWMSITGCNYFKLINQYALITKPNHTCTVYLYLKNYFNILTIIFLIGNIGDSYQTWIFYLVNPEIKANKLQIQPFIFFTYRFSSLFIMIVMEKSNCKSWCTVYSYTYTPYIGSRCDTGYSADRWNNILSLKNNINMLYIYFNNSVI